MLFACAVVCVRYCLCVLLPACAVGLSSGLCVLLSLCACVSVFCCLCVLLAVCAVVCVCCWVILGLVICTNTPSHACLTLAHVGVRACVHAHTGTSHDVRGGFNEPFSNGIHEWPSRTSQDVMKQGQGGGSRASQEDTGVGASQERRKRRKGAGGAGTGEAEERNKSSRFWTKDEHELFLEALDKYHYPSVAAGRKGHEERAGGAESSCAVSVGLGQGVAEIIASHVRVCGCMCVCMSLVCVFCALKCVCVCCFSRVHTDTCVMPISNACHISPSRPSFPPLPRSRPPFLRTSLRPPSLSLPPLLFLARPASFLRSPAQHSKCDHTRKSTSSACRKSARKHHHMLGARLRRQQRHFPGVSVTHNGCRS
jgi:hypothetical protein